MATTTAKFNVKSEDVEPCRRRGRGDAIPLKIRAFRTLRSTTLFLRPAHQQGRTRQLMSRSERVLGLWQAGYKSLSLSPELLRG